MVEPPITYFPCQKNEKKDLEKEGDTDLEAPDFKEAYGDNGVNQICGKSCRKDKQQSADDVPFPQRADVGAHCGNRVGDGISTCVG